MIRTPDASPGINAGRAFLPATCVAGSDQASLLFWFAAALIHALILQPSSVSEPEMGLQFEEFC
jgi:hypothetical protein